jgi:hypothetical protein
MSHQSLTGLDHVTFVVSFVLLVWCALRVSARAGNSAADRYWIGIATVMLQLGAITSLTSSIHQLRPGAWIAVQIVLCAVTLRFTGGFRAGSVRRVAGWRDLPSELAAFLKTLSPQGLAVLLVIGVMLALSAITQIATPIRGADERMYHASRVLYWIQYQTAFPFSTHNDRQNIVPFGSELFFLWPVLLTHSEVVGRIVFWLAYPCAAIGQYLLLRALKLSRTVALAGALILIATPLVSASAVSLKPELWFIVSLLGMSYWTVSICLHRTRMAAACFFLGVFAMLSVNVRAFPLVILPIVAVIPLLRRRGDAAATRLKAVAAGLACAGVLSGFLIPVGFNLAHYRHPFGPPGARQVVLAEVSPRQLYTHAVRFAFVLLELPDAVVPAETRARLGALANRFITAVGAGSPLPMETESDWPGAFVYALPERAARFSLWGLLWIPTLLVAAVLLIRNVRATWPRVSLAAIPALTLLALPLVTAILFGARWMVRADVPARYLIGAYALTLPIGIVVALSYIKGRKLAESLAVIAVAVAVYQPMRVQTLDALNAVTAPSAVGPSDRGFEEALAAMPERSRIVLIGAQNAPDYVLFSPGHRYSNAVIPWGKTPFDPARMRDLIESRNATHVLVQDDRTLSLHWDSGIRTDTMVAWLAGQPRLREIPLTNPHMRLFETASGSARHVDTVVRTTVEQRLLGTTIAPASAPLIKVGVALQGRVGIDADVLETPWPVEPAPDGGLLWLGQGRGEGVRFVLWSSESRAVNLRGRMAAGPSVIGPDRTVVVLRDGAPVAYRKVQGETEVVLPVTLQRGRNAIEIVALDAANVTRLPNGDPRRLIVLLREVRAEPSLPATPPAGRRGSSEGPDADGSRALHEDFARHARRAADVVINQQQPAGYWVTSYTSSTSFERPALEMNTYTTSLMVDVLDPMASATGLEGSVQLARRHLASQIESGGLVRYHGKPDAPTIGALGCEITPDADDTALVWRIAPGPNPQLLTAALATLAQYRTADHLYRTWLAPQARYQCIDPGADPNPADIGIQMHIYMLLARSDPAAAQDLCRALRTAIDDERHWVYYSVAPLVPLLRQVDLQRAGCAVEVPPSRIAAAPPGQEPWMATARLIERFQDSTQPRPESDEVVDLLRRLADRDFEHLRQSPPLVYHNDLTASVRRFYWSEEYGYALWLRLYVEGERHGLLRAARHERLAGVRR